MFKELLHERLLRALEQLALTEPTPIQQAFIPVALEGKDIQAGAETGSGKTAAYVLPLLQQMLNKPAPTTATRALILLPTRELAQQVDKHCRDLAAFTQIKTSLLVGGTSFAQQKAAIRKNPEVVIGTVGRVLEHVQKRSLELGDLEFLVLDEADRMLDMGFRDEVLAIAQACAPARQTMLLSATLTREGLGRIAAAVLREPELIAIGTHRSAHAAIRQQIVLADDPAHKQQLCSRLLAQEEFDKALVFCNTREQTEHLAQFLSRQRGPDKEYLWQDKGRSRVACLHGELTQDERKRLMHWFREGVLKILVATDLAARGLDVKGVDLVLNFDLPRSGDEYVHRIGRTGRAGETGLAISLIAPQEYNRMSSIERYLALTFEPRKVEGLEARFKGPTGKTKKPKAAKKETKTKKKVVPKAQQRHRYKKNIGKRRKPSEAKVDSEGLKPLKRK